MWKKIAIGVVVFAVVGGIGYGRYKKAHTPPTYETVTVMRGLLTQSVDATGKIESTNALDLRFEIPGSISAITVKEGQSVVKGALLANLRLADLNAQVAQAQANLNLKLAGATEQDKEYYKAAVEAAKAALEQAENGSSLITSQAYENVVVALQASVPKLDDALTQADNLLGIDSPTVNETFRTILAANDPTKLGPATSQYLVAKNANTDFRLKASLLTPQSNSGEVDAALLLGVKAFQNMNMLLNNVSDVLRVTPAQNGLYPQSVLDGRKSTIEATRSAVSAQYASVIARKQDVDSSKTMLAQKQAAYQQALANYESKTSAPREVDVAAYRAQLAQAVANRNKGVITAPIDGIITKVNKKVGEAVSSADVIVKLLSPHYQIEVDIPETDVPKLKVNNQVKVTLDAFGEDTKFDGTVVAIEPGATEVQDVVYYKVTISLADTDKAIKPGMTANVSIATAARENTLSIPVRVVRTRDGAKYVRVLENGQPKEVAVKLGLKGDEGMVEVVDGLTEGQTIIVSQQ